MSKKAGRILVVDDDPFVGEMLAIVLEGEGYEVSAAGGGREALGMLGESGGAALVLTDMLMPGMDGLELTREIRKLDGRVPVLILSARDDEEFRRMALESGARGCLVKDEELMERIGSVVAETLQGVSS